MKNYAGLNKVFKDIDKAVTKDDSVSEETKAKRDAIKKIHYYNKLRKKSQ